MGAGDYLVVGAKNGEDVCGNMGGGESIAAGVGDVPGVWAYVKEILLADALAVGMVPLWALGMVR